MVVSEKMLFGMAKLMSSQTVAHSDEQKAALETEDAYNEYRLTLKGIVTEAAERYNVEIKDKIVLDLGCADGSISIGYLDYGAKHIIGVDIDPVAIAKAQEKYTTDKSEFHLSSVESIPLEDNSVDTILCYDVFEHVEKPETILKEVRRVLKPGGQMLVATWGWKHPFAPHLWSTMPVPWAHVFVSEKTLLRTCQRVYESDWYTPTYHDYDEDGNLKVDKYKYDKIPTDYLNKYLVKDFVRVFNNSKLDAEIHLAPFGSAMWTKIFLQIPWVREFFVGYLWAVLTKPAEES